MAALFQALPGRLLLLLPDGPAFTVAAVSGGCTAVAGAADGVGRSIFEAWYCEEPEEGWNTRLRASLEDVRQTGRAQEMGRTLLDGPAGRPVNRPVLDPGTGAVRYIVHDLDEAGAARCGAAANAFRYVQTLIDEFKDPLQILQPVFEGDAIVDFRFRLTNQAYAAYAKTTPEALRGQRVGAVFPGYFATKSFHNPVHTYKTGEALTFEVHYDQDGLDLYNQMSTSRLGDEVLVHFTDFTHLKRMQLQLEGVVEELRRSNEDLQQFAHMASHDLKEPVRKILTFSELLASTDGPRLSERGRLYLAKVGSAAGRVMDMVNGVLLYSWLGTADQPRETIDLAALLAGVESDLEVPIRQKHAAIAKGVLPPVAGVPMLIRQLFYNLLNNALKFSRAGVPAQIAIEGVAVPDGVRIAIADNGIGFEPEYADHIFQTFSRLHPKDQYEGTGLGLSLCRKIVERHGGTIRAEGRPGLGATFEMILPGALPG